MQPGTEPTPPPLPPQPNQEDHQDLPAAILLVLDASGHRSRIPLTPLPFRIGRHGENHLVLRDNRASRHHARIVAENGNYVIEDLESRHGTWVNGQRISRHVLRGSDRIDLGVRDSYQLTFVLDAGGITRIIDQMSDQVTAPISVRAPGTLRDKLPSPSHASSSGAESLGKLRSLVEVARALQNSLSTQEVLTAVIDAALAVTGCERGFLLMRKAEELEVSVARDSSGQPLEAGDLRVPTAVIHRALTSRKDLLSMSFDPAEESGIRPEMTVAALELRGVVCLPLIRVRSGSAEETSALSAERDTVGLLYLDSREAAADLSAGNRELLQTLAIEASTILENARLIEEERVKLRMEDELRIAREIQQGLVPTDLPSGGWFHAAGSTWPSAEVGGDYFDVQRLAPDRWSAVVADVAGKGVSSALMAGILQGSFLMAAGEAHSMQTTMRHLNRFLLERTRGEKYATIFYCIVTESGALSYVNAGHCAPYLLKRSGDLKKLHTSGMPVGMLEEAEFDLVQLQLEPGDKLVIYSDGLTEAADSSGQFFDARRLRACLRDHRELRAEALHEVLLDTVDRFSEGGQIRDDITALVLEYAPPEG